MQRMNKLNHSQIYSLVRRIPKGRVATYGQIARLLGFPRHARQVGYALAALDNDDSVPWHRVINAQGTISERGKPGYVDYQRLLLEDEGVTFDHRGRVALEKYQWQVA